MRIYRQAGHSCIDGSGFLTDATGQVTFYCCFDKLGSRKDYARV
jgi:hypothetical protein